MQSGTGQDGTGHARTGAKMPGGLKALIAVFGSIFLVSGVALLGLTALSKGGSGRLVSAGALQPDQGVAGLSVPTFSGLDIERREVTDAVFKGRVTIVDFIFTHCPFICPKLTGIMQQMAHQLDGTGVRFLSMSVDPTRDTPERLGEYARERKIDLSRWTFVHVDDATVKRVVSGALQFALEVDPKTDIALPGGGSMKNIMHPSHYVLIGPAGEVLGIYSSNDPAQVQALTARAREAARLLERR